MANIHAMIEGMQADIISSSSATSRMTIEEWRVFARTHRMRLDLERWEEHKDMIRHIYLTDNRSLVETQRIMYETYGILPSERMYKQRFISWSWPPKKLTRDTYNAMITLDRYLSSQYGTSVKITVSTGSRPRDHIDSKTIKQLNRASRQGQNGWRPMQLSEAFDVLLGTQHLQPRVSWENIETDLASLRDSDATRLVRSSAASQLSLSSGPTSPVSDDEAPAREIEQDSSRYLRRSSKSDAMGTPRDFSDTLVTPNDGRCARCPQSKSHFDYDQNMELEKMMAGMTMQSFTSQTASSAKTEKALVTDWCVPCVLECFTNDLCSEAEFYQSPSIDRLLDVLDSTSDNRFLLPCLTWTTCVLFSNCRRKQLRQLVEASTHLIISATSSTSVLRLPFQMVSAELRQNKVEVQEIGEQIIYAYPQVRTAYKEGHPNTVVYFYYWCWYSSWYQDAHGMVVGELLTALPTIKRLLGAHNSLTLSCMVMLGRCQTKIGQFHEAILILRDALHELGQPSKHMIAYRLFVLYLLAKAEVGADDFYTAERHFQEVLSGRLELFGIGAANEDAVKEVWRPIFDLKELLEQLGRGEEADDLMHHYWTQHETARCRWHRERGETPPQAIAYPGLRYFDDAAERSRSAHVQQF